MNPWNSSSGLPSSSRIVAISLWGWLLAVVIWVPLHALLPFSYYPAFVLFPPHVLALSGIALALLFARPPSSLRHPERWMLACAGLLLLINLCHFLHDPTQRFEHLGSGLLWVAIPVAVWLLEQPTPARYATGRGIPGASKSPLPTWLFPCPCPATCNSQPNETPRKAAFAHAPADSILPAFMAFLWFLNLLKCLGQWLYGLEVTGLAGNRNWHAAFLICTLPLVWLFLRERLAPCKQRQRLFGYGLLASASGLLLYSAHSRAAWLTVVILSLLAISLEHPKLRRRLAMLLVIVGALLLGFVLFLKSGPVVGVVFDDVRVPLWGATLQMIREHPWAGVSHAAFEASLCGYRTPAYFLRANAAVRTNHPHQQFLYMAAALGLPGLLAWGYLWLYPLIIFLRRYRQWAALPRCVAWGLLSLVVASCFDLALFEWPTVYIAGIYLGVLWRHTRHDVDDPAMDTDAAPAIATSCPPRSAWQLRLAGCLLLVICLHESVLSARYSYWAVIATQRENRGPLSSALPAYDCALAIRKDPEFLYRYAWLTFQYLADPALALRCIRLLDETPHSSFAYNHRLQAICLQALGRNQEALAQARIDTDHHPISIAALHQRLRLETRLNMSAAAQTTSARLAWAMQLKGLEPADLPAVLSDPENDLHFYQYLARRDAEKNAPPVAP
jgi:hypothetical protein